MSDENPWSHRIAAATDAEAQRGLLAEVLTWRARHLTEVAVLRQASEAAAILHHMLNERDKATHELSVWESLCETPPKAGKGEWRRLAQTRAFLRGERVAPPAGPSPATSPRERLQGAVRAASRGRWSEAQTLLDGLDSDRAELVRTLVWLARARGRGATRREHDLAQLEKRLARHLGVERRASQPAPVKDKPKPPPVEAPPPSPEEAALAELLGRSVPSRRAARARAIEEAALATPERADALAAAALRHHISDAGLAVPAPWLAGVVSLARAGGEAPALDAAMAALSEQGAACLAIYQEAPFARLVEVLRTALAAGERFAGLRRGVLTRDAIEDRRVWTLRLDKGETQRMLAIAPEVTSPWPEPVLAAMVERLRALCERIVLDAPGELNTPLRDGAQAVGISLLEGEPLAALDAVAAVELAAPRRRKPETKPAGDARAPSPPKQLRAMFSADSAPELEALAAVVGALNRPGESFGIARRSLPSEHFDAGVALLLQAVEALQVPVEQTVEGTGVVLDAAARAPEGKVATWLGSEAGQARFGGAGLDTVMAVLRAVPQDAGWRVGTVLRGTTPRERTQDPVVGSLGDGALPLWRAVLRQGKGRREIWVLTALSPEARAAAIALAKRESPRLVLAEGADLEWAQAGLAGTPVHELGALDTAVAGFLAS